MEQPPMLWQIVAPCTITSCRELHTWVIHPTEAAANEEMLRLNVQHPDARFSVRSTGRFVIHDELY